MERVAVTANCNDGSSVVFLKKKTKEKVYLDFMTLLTLGGHSQIVKGSLGLTEAASWQICMQDLRPGAQKIETLADTEGEEERIFLRLFKRQMTFVYCHSSYARKKSFAKQYYKSLLKF